MQITKKQNEAGKKTANKKNKINIKIRIEVAAVAAAAIIYV